MGEDEIQQSLHLSSSCDDGFRNGGESGIDCGGSSNCARCATQEICTLGLREEKFLDNTYCFETQERNVTGCLNAENECNKDELVLCDPSSLGYDDPNMIDYAHRNFGTTFPQQSSCIDDIGTFHCCHITPMRHIIDERSSCVNDDDCQSGSCNVYSNINYNAFRNGEYKITSTKPLSLSGRQIPGYCTNSPTYINIPIEVSVNRTEDDCTSCSSRCSGGGKYHLIGDVCDINAQSSCNIRYNFFERQQCLNYDLSLEEHLNQLFATVLEDVVNNVKFNVEDFKEDTNTYIGEVIVTMYENVTTVSKVEKTLSLIHI